MFQRDFLSCDRGSVAVTFGLSLVVLVIAVGCAVDYVRAVRLHMALQSAADAASLAGASHSLVKVGRPGRGGGTDQKRIKVAKRIFEQNLRAAVGLDLTPDVRVEDGVVKVSIEHVLGTVFMRVANIYHMDLAVQSEAVSGTRAQRDIYLVLDMSASLGLAADEVNRRRLMQLSRPWTRSSGEFSGSHPNGCMFACHGRSGFEPYGKNSYDLAKRAGIRLREDVLLDASSAFIRAVLDRSIRAVRDGDVRVGVFGFSNSARWLSKPTSNQSSAMRSVSTFPEKDRDDTLADVAFPWFERQARGESGSRNRTFVIVTDGVTGGKSRNFTWSELDTRLCQSLKDNGADVFVLEVKYEDLSGDSFYDTYVSRFDRKISPALEACASPGQHMQASTPDEISAAFRDIAQSINRAFTRLVN